MAEHNESDQERSLPASPRRIEQAREEGQVPRSRALSHVAVIGTGAGALWLFGPALIGRYTIFMAEALRLDREAALSAEGMTHRLSALTLEAGMLLLPIALVLSAMGAAAALGLGGFNFTWKPLAPKLNRVDPLSGLQRLLSYESAIELGKVLLEATLIVVVVGLFLWFAVPEFASVVVSSQDGGIEQTVRLILGSALAMTAALAIAAAVDVPLQLWRHYRSLRMTPEEARREARETEGDPHLKGRIRRAQRDVARRRMMEKVPRADVVITNPTHFAVALAYDADKDGAPRVVAKGTELVAQRIRELATEHRVPVLESPALARALYTHAELDSQVPQALYEAVAQVLAYVFRLRAIASGAALLDEQFEPVEIPLGMDPQGATR
jgi:flagellar biosynthetic protein FlhB